MTIRHWLAGAAVCALGCTQAFAAPLSDTHLRGPSPGQVFDAAGFLSRFGLTGPAILRVLGTGAPSWRVTSPIPPLAHDNTDLVLVLHGDQLWIQQRP
jgi:hypothetical protein